jgi:hypothetical protein
MVEGLGGSTCRNAVWRILGALVKRAYALFPLDPLAHEVESRPMSSSSRNSREIFHDADSGICVMGMTSSETLYRRAT